MNNLTSDGLQLIRASTHTAYSENRATVQVWVTTMLALLADYDAMTERMRELESQIATMRDIIASHERSDALAQRSEQYTDKVIAELRNRLDVIMGYDMPELFNEWTRAEKEEYSQTSPTQMFNEIRESRQRIAELERENNMLRQQPGAFAGMLQMIEDN